MRTITTTIITDMLTRTTTTTELSAAALYRLTTWLSPAYPVGGFAYSGGIEWAVEAGDITSPETLRDWLETMLGHGAGLQRRNPVRAGLSRGGR